MLQPSLQSFDSHSLSRQILIIDTHVNDHQFLIANASPEFDIFVLDPGRDGIIQITEILQSLKLQLINCFSLHLVSHGSPGCLYLGNSQLSLDTLKTYSQQLKTWCVPQSSLFLYGCNVAAGDAGEEFLGQLYCITQANIYASSQAVGSLRHGGTWQLNLLLGRTSGRISVSPWTTSVLSSYQGMFNTPPADQGAPNNPTLTSTYNTSGESRDVVVIGNYAYTADGSSGLQIIDISNPENPILIGNYNTSGYANGISVVGNYAYVTDATNGLQIIDVSNPASPISIGSYSSSHHMYDVSIVGNYAYVADGNSGLQIIDISDPNSPTLVGNCDISSRVEGVSIVGNYAYIVSGYNGLQIIDVSDPNSPVLLSAQDTPGYASSVTIFDNYAYVADGADGLQIIDISNPNSLALIGTYNTLGFALDVKIIGNYAYVADGFRSLQIIDISDPSNPVSTGTINSGSSGAYGVSVVGNYAYIAKGFDGLQIIELGSNPIAISGTPQEDNLLTADTSNLADADGLPDSSTYTYKWQQFDGFTWNDITGATDNTFTPGDDQVGQEIRVQMSYTDQGGTTETVTSAGVIITNINDAPFGTATGTVPDTVEDTDLIIDYQDLIEGFSDADGDNLFISGLTADAGTIIDNRDGTYTFSPNADHNGSATLTYTVTDGNGGEIRGVTRSFFVTPANDTPVGKKAPSSPTLVITYDTLVHAEDLRVLGNYAYVIFSDAQGLQVIDISDPNSPILVSDNYIGNYAEDISIVGDYVYIATRYDGLQIIDISNPGDPIFVSSYDDYGNISSVSAVEVVGDYAYIGGGFNDGLQIVEINYEYPLSTYSISGWIRDINVIDKYVYVAVEDDFNSSLQIIDISDPYNPFLVSTYDISGRPEDLKIAGDYAYVAASYGGLQVINISDPYNPIFASEYNTSGFARDINIVGNYAYIAVNDTDSGLQILDISDPNNLVLIGSFNASGNVTGISVVGNYAYLTDETEGLQIIDLGISIDPISISGVPKTDNLLTADSFNLVDADGLPDSGTYTYQWQQFDGFTWNDIVGATDSTFTPGDDQINKDIRVQMSYTDQGDTTETVASDQVRITDVNNTPPSGSATGTIPDAAEDTDLIIQLSTLTEGFSDAEGDSLYVVDLITDTGSIVDNGDGTYIFSPNANYNGSATLTYTVTDNNGGDITGVIREFAVTPVNDAPVGEALPENPTLASTYDALLSAWDISVSGNYAYVISNDYQGLQAIYISDPNTPILVSDNSIGNYAEDITIVGDYAYIATRYDGLQVVDISNPNNPTLIGSYDNYGNTSDVSAVEVIGNYAYIGDNGFNGGLQIVDISDQDSYPYKPSRLSTYDVSGGIRDINVIGNYAYVAVEDDFNSSLQIIDISDPYNPFLVSTYDISASRLEELEIVGGYAYIASADSGLQVIDISDPYNLTTVSEYYTTFYAHDINIVGNYAYVAAADSGLQVVDISDPSNPVLVSSYNTSGDATGISVIGNYAYVVDYNTGLHVINLGIDIPIAINGIPEEDSLLTADISNLVDADGLPDSSTYTYQWQQFDGFTWNDIAGATDSTFTPSNDQANQLIRVQISYVDQGGTAETVTSDSIEIASNNSAPTGTATGIVSNTAEDTDLIIQLSTLLEGFSDPDSDALSVTGLTSNEGTLIDNGDGTYTLSPDENFNGNVTLTYTVTDNNGGDITGVTRSFLVTPANDAPDVANELSDQTATEDGAFSYTIPDDAFSDVDAGDLITYSATLADGSALPSWLNFNGNSFSGTPLNEDVGTLLITVTATDQSGAATSNTFSLVVENTNDAPTVAHELSNQTAIEDEAFSYTIPANAFSDTDVGDSLTFTATLADGSALPTWLSFDGSRFTGTPFNEDVGVLSITVIATDQLGAITSNTFDLVIENINDAPTGTATGIVPDTTEDTDLIIQLSTLLEGFSDPESDALSVSGLTSDAGTMVDNNDGTFTFSPDADFNGSVTLTYTVTDSNGGDITGVSRSFSVTSVNDAPTVANELSDQTATEDEVFSYTIPSDTFSDIDSNDSLTLDATLADGAPLPTWLSFDGNSFTGIPLNADVGVLSITITAIDQSGDTISNTFDLVVENVNDAPTGVATSIVPDTAEDNDLIIQLSTLLEGFTDADGDTLSVSGLTADVGTLMDNNDGTYTFSPDADYNGRVTLTYTVTDNNGGDITGVTHTFSVTSVNDAPAVANEFSHQTAIEDEVFSYTIPVNAFSDVDAGDSLTFSATLADGTPLPSWLSFDGSSFSGTPLNADVGVLSITVIATDQSGATTSDTFNLTIANTNDSPTGTASGTVSNTLEDNDLIIQLSTLLEGFSDPDGDVLLVIGLTSDEGSVIDNGDGTYTFSPNANFNGTVTLTYTVTDSNGGDITGVFRSFSVTPVNDAPTVANELSNQTAIEDEIFSYTIPSDTFSDIDVNDPLTLVATLADGTPLPSWLSFDGNNFSGTPLNENVGVLSITVTATDQADATSSDTFELTIENINDPAVITGDAVGSVTEDASTSSVTGSLSASDIDSTVGFTAQTHTVGMYGSFSIDAQGNWLYTLNNADEDTNVLIDGNAVTETFTVTTDDGTAQDIVITVNGTDDSKTDFNGDDLPDLVWRNASRGLTSIWFTDGQNRLSSGSTSDTVSSSSWITAGVGDYDKDGNRDDILWRNTVNGQNVIWFMDGLNKVGNATLDTVTNTDWTIQGIGDFDHSGYVDDILWQHQGNGSTIVWTMDGATKTGNLDFGTVDTDWQAQGVGDFEANGNIDDIVWRNRQTGQNTIWETDGLIVENTVTTLPTMGANWRIEGVSDFDGDGYTDDLLWRNHSILFGGQITTWSIDNGSVTNTGSISPTVFDLAWDVVV
ncbi:MAG: cadherin-like domain-containing protein [Thainema sp.]